MEKDLIDVVPCTSIAVDSVIRLGTAGALWGACRGPYEARKRDLIGIARASYVGKSIGKYGFQCGYVAGILNITQCGLKRYRRKNDWVNALIAGAVAGAAVAAGTRSGTKMISMAGLVSAFSVAADHFKSS
ncbi:outer envelope pore protein 16-4 chloroplastic-like isoform X1 [Tripterygium wilfordii]|uniref:Outer envelope pore protein 16-4 chloroplastic-like isoform X1 n=1 Tax=Tripterygium wilfordii TaxID=458696 RepID=A0A7J7CES0_TRIWF|nr:outer envelope pore protein 16-4, chloroplastic-like [Tripterygium wilfordii]KAF5732651.1 outer envelope pore protein 16-4 chloroplastic-like isoform X1 [Tripterygium wilfordii]